MKRYNKFWVTLAALAAWLVAVVVAGLDAQVAGTVILALASGLVYAVPNIEDGGRH